MSLLQSLSPADMLPLYLCKWRDQFRRRRTNEGQAVTNHLRKWGRILCSAVCLATSVLLGCSKKEVPRETAAQPHTQENSKPAAVPLPMPYGQHTDDLDAMVKRRNIRTLVIINPIGFFYDNGQPMGAIFEAMREFQTFLNQKFKTGVEKVQVTFIPVRPDQLEAALTQGMGDIITNALVVTPERQQRVA